MNKQLKMGTITSYGMGHFGYGFVTQAFASYLVFFATAILNLPGAAIGTMVAIGIVWDAISDPIMGYISDHTKSRFGNRHIYILVGTFLVSIFNILLWITSPSIATWIKLVWIFTILILLKTSITVFITPYYALGAEMTSDYDERSKIQASKTIFFLIAIVGVTTICMLIFFKPTDLYPIGQLNPAAYKQIAYLGSFLMIFSGLLTYFTTLKYKVKTLHTDTNIKNMIAKIRFSLTSKSFNKILIGYLCTNSASAVISVVGLHMFTYTFSMDNIQIGKLLGIQFLFCIVFQPLWIKFSEKYDKKKTVLTGLIISMIGCLILFIFVFLNKTIQTSFEYLYIYGVIVGIGTSPLFSIPGSMVADTVDEQEYLTGERNEGVYFGVLNLAYKLSQSVVILIMGFALDLIRFDALLDMQSNFTIVSLGLLLSLGSLLSFILAYAAYKHYGLNKEIVQTFQSELLKRKLAE